MEFNQTVSSYTIIVYTAYVNTCCNSVATFFALFATERLSSFVTCRSSAPSIWSCEYLIFARGDATARNGDGSWSRAHAGLSRFLRKVC